MPVHSYPRGAAMVSSFLVFMLLMISNGHAFSSHCRYSNTVHVRSTRLFMSSSNASEKDDGNHKLVIVTGGARGIGKATCLLLASRGYQVAVNHRSNTEAAQQVVNEIGTDAKAFQADVSDEKQVEKLFDKVIAHFGRNPTSLVCNAGVMEPMQKDITLITKETLDADFATNTYGPFFCTREFVKRTSTKHGGKGGSIVNVSSVSADGGQIVAYAMSKSATEAMVNVRMSLMHCETTLLIQAMHDCASEAYCSYFAIHITLTLLLYYTILYRVLQRHYHWKAFESIQWYQV